MNKQSDGAVLKEYYSKKPKKKTKTRAQKALSCSGKSS